MTVEKRNPKDVGGCNYCSRIRYDLVNNESRYEYEYVYSVEGDGLKTRFCQICLDDLKHRTNNI
jgi:hypothetical protein